jgi:spermidine/putrescine-binding protein
MSNITIHLELNQQQAEQYLQWLNSQYDTTMADVWYSDRYRNVPKAQRAPKVLQDVPHLAGICRTRNELKKQLGANIAERAQ